MASVKTRTKSSKARRAKNADKKKGKKVKKKKSAGTVVKNGRFKIKKNEDNRIMCEVSSFKGNDYLNIRYQYQDDDGEWRFTSKGISIPFNNGLADSFIEKFKENF